jgi:hypothetical protein
MRCAIAHPWIGSGAMVLMIRKSTVPCRTSVGPLTPPLLEITSQGEDGAARPKVPSHEGLNITESDWVVMERHAVAVLDKFGIQGREREEFLGAAASLKGDIVQSH